MALSHLSVKLMPALERFTMVRDTLDDECLVSKLERHRGNEKDRETVKYTCPAAHYGTDCPGKQECEKGYGRCVRVKAEVDPRVFVPTPRHTIKFERGYRRRTAVERINGLFNELFGIKRMKVGGLPSARLRVSMMVMTVLTMAVARIHNDQKEKMTSIVAAA